MSKDDLTPDRLAKAEQKRKEQHATVAEPEQPPEFALTEDEAQRAMEFFRQEQNLLMGAVSGFLAAVVGAAAWAAITVATEYQSGWMAVGIGFLVGIAVRIGGKGIDPVFGVVGAVMSLVGCVLGNLFTIAYIISVDSGMPVMDVLSQMDLRIVAELMLETFQVMDVLFYALALYFGYRYAFRELNADDFNRALGRAM